MRARRLPVIDEYVDGDQMAVFAHGQLVVLSAVATAALRTLDERWTDMAEVIERVVDAVGPPPTGSRESAVGSVIQELAHLGLVEVSPRVPHRTSTFPQHLPEKASNREDLDAQGDEGA